jgi:hypothetical protein
MGVFIWDGCGGCVLNRPAGIAESEDAQEDDTEYDGNPAQAEEHPALCSAGSFQREKHSTRPVFLGTRLCLARRCWRTSSCLLPPVNVDIFDIIGTACMGRRSGVRSILARRRARDAYAYIQRARSCGIARGNDRDLSMVGKF